MNQHTQPVTETPESHEPGTSEHSEETTFEEQIDSQPVCSEPVETSVAASDSHDHQTEMMVSMDRIQQKLDELGNDFRAKLKYDDQKQKIIDQLHSELQEYRNDLIRSLLRPVLLDVVHLADDQRKLLANYAGKAPEDLNPAKLLKLMNDIPESLDDILYGQGVDIFRNDEPAFDPKCQKALEKVETADPELNRTIARSIRPGYRWDGHVLRPEIVAVFVYRPQKDTAAEAGTSQDQKEHHHE